MKEQKYLLWGIAGGAALLAVLYFVTKGAKASDVGVSIGETVVDVTEGAIVGVLGEAGDIVGLPKPSETIKDPELCLLYLNEHGYWAASAACSAPAFLEATINSMSQ